MDLAFAFALFEAHYVVSLALAFARLRPISVLCIAFIGEGDFAATGLLLLTNVGCTLHTFHRADFIVFSLVFFLFRLLSDQSVSH